MVNRKEFDEIIYDYRRLVEEIIAPFMEQWMEIKHLCDEHKDALLSAIKRRNQWWNEIDDIELFFNTSVFAGSGERHIKIWAYKNRHVEISTEFDICTLYDFMESAGIISHDLNK